MGGEVGLVNGTRIGGRGCFFDPSVQMPFGPLQTQKQRVRGGERQFEAGGEGGGGRKVGQDERI